MSERVDWASLRQAHGTCEHVPAALRDLTSPDAVVRRAAYWRLDNHVVLQGDLHEGAPFVARAVLALLAGAVDGRAEMYDLLVELANGEAPESRRVVLDGRSRTIPEATRSVLATGLAQYRADLGSGSAVVRTHVANLLLALAAELALDTDELQKLVRRENDPSVAALLHELVAANRGTREP